MLLPPPNVTGNLHMGHALTVTIQDALVKWHKMRGDAVRWIPGFDHAGIATQSVVQKTTKDHEATKEDLLRWTEQKKTEIRSQLDRMAVSLDWDREFFTLDARMSSAATEAFKRLFRQGIIFRKKGMVNYSPALRTVVSDLEVDWLKVPGRKTLTIRGDIELEVGVLTHMIYESADQRDKIVVATTRPETLFGDVAIAVNPDDTRWSHLIGRVFLNSFTGREMPVIGDPRVKPEFGSGALKITPAHSSADFDIAQSHDLPSVEVINEDGRLNDECGREFSGLDRLSARSAVISELQSRGLLDRQTELETEVPICSRSGDLIEPRLLEQWFLRSSELAPAVVEAVKNGKVDIRPEGGKKTLLHWLDNVHDWCISRQINWGHRIPAYLHEGRWNVDGKGQQDQDVLDTWFMSALLPLAVNGWPDKVDEIYYPLSLMETGSDILFFWVARMMLLCMALEPGRAPFEKVLLHGIVTDAMGRKMSKSLGNVVDPVQVIEGYSLESLKKDARAREEVGLISKKEMEVSLKGAESLFPKGIPKIGVDAMRFTLCVPELTNQFMNLDLPRMQTISFFCNKIWQATRFAVGFWKEGGRAAGSLAIAEPETKLDKWILSRLADTVERCNVGFEEMRLDHVTEAIYAFVYSDLCDLYVESIKQRNRPGARSSLYASLSSSLKLMAPLMPHVAEELWQRLHATMGWPAEGSVLQQSYPVADTQRRDPQLEDQVSKMRKVVEDLRRVRQSYGIKWGKTQVWTQEKGFLDFPISELAGCELRLGVPPKSSLHLGEEVAVDVAGSLTEEELQKRVSALEADVKKLEGKIASGKLTEKRRRDVAEKYTMRTAELQQLLLAVSSK